MKFKIQQCVSHPAEFNPTINNMISVGVEIQDFAYPAVLDGDWEERLEDYQKKLEKFQGTVSIHGPYMDLNPASPDSKIKAASRERYLQVMKIAQSLRASYLIYHSQIDPALKKPEIKELKINNQLDFWKEMIEEAEKSNITILLENFAEEHFNDLLLLIERINSPSVKILLDIGHVLTNSSFSLLDWLEGLKSRIEYIHFHWNDGSFDAHQSPEESFIKEVTSYLNQLNLNPVLSLEYDIDDIKTEIARLKGGLKG